MIAASAHGVYDGFAKFVAGVGAEARLEEETDFGYVGGAYCLGEAYAVAGYLVFL